MARVLSEAHKAAMAAGRTAKAELRREDRQQLSIDFVAWSKDNARLYLAWEENCGKVCDEPCDTCKAYRASNSAMPGIKRS